MKRLLVASALLFGLCACNSLEKAAKEDPMKCERDPKCEKKRNKSADCTTQCIDDPACMSRCEEFQSGTGDGRLGH